MTRVTARLGSSNQEKGKFKFRITYFSGTHLLKCSKLSEYANDNKTSLQPIRVTVTRK